MASEIVAGEVEQASTDHFIDRAWWGIGEAGHLPPGMAHRLRRADRSLFAGGQIARMLVGDSHAKQEAGDTGKSYNGLDQLDVEALGIALVELLDVACAALDEVREKEADRVTEKALLEAVRAAA